MRKKLKLQILLLASLSLAAKAQSSAPPDLTRQPTLYVVGYAHLDTEWRWEYPQVIREYLSKTMRSNFALFEKYPHYIFNFTGANRYRLMREYYPADFERLKHYVAAGRWFPAGSSVEESDVNSPSAESIFRQVLYGNEFFRREFGKASAEYMLPDCFGFPASLPSILAHAGIKGFSTQKLTWGSSAPVGGPDSPERTPRGTPFNVGIWEGPDGRSLLAAFNPGSYSADITTDLSKPLPPLENSSDAQDAQQQEFRRYQGDWAKRVLRNGEVSGLFTDYHYYGTGDIGGAPREPAIKLLEAIIDKSEITLPPPRRSGQQQPQPAAPPGSPVRVGEGPVHVISANADQMFLDIEPDQTARLPRYKGDLELTNHSAGSLTSEAYQKRWNRKNELLADAAERASVIAQWLGARPYPQQRLNNAWTLVLGGQFHDIMAGTATPQSYNYAWNDDAVAMNQFAGVLTSATEAIASGMETQATGIPVLVYNPLNIPREDVVEIEIPFLSERMRQATIPSPSVILPAPAGRGSEARTIPHRGERGRVEGPLHFLPIKDDSGSSHNTADSRELPQHEMADNSTPKSVQVYGPDGKESPSQLLSAHDGMARVLFLASIPAVGYSVYDVRLSAQPLPEDRRSQLAVTGSSLENARYRIKLDHNGDVSSIFDKTLNKELISAPLRLAFQTEKPHDWPAWNMDWDDQKQPPRAYVQGPAKVSVVEAGLVRVALQVERQAENSTFVQTVRLSLGDAGNRIEFLNAIDWKTKEAALKATFPLTAKNPEATYNWDIGTIQRGNNDEKKFEVASHQWFDLTDSSAAYGVTVLSDCKYGSDKPDDGTLRLTLLYTPGLGGGNGSAYSDQLTQDWGHHEFIYGLAGHAGDWRKEQSDWQALRLNQPLIAFRTVPHAGPLGKTFPFLKIDHSRIRVLALKKAEQSNQFIVRLVEMDGKQQASVQISFPRRVVGLREVNAQEQEISANADTKVKEGTIVTNFSPYQARTFVFVLAPPGPGVSPAHFEPLKLDYDVSVATHEGKPGEGCFDCLLSDPTAAQGKALPAEMLPASIDYAGIRFNLAPTANSSRNAVSAHGQTIKLPEGKFNRVYLLAAAANGDQSENFKVGDKEVELTIQDWSGHIGQWDNRSWNTHQEPVKSRPGSPGSNPGAPPRMRTVMEFTGKITPGFIKRDDVAWFASHLHLPDGSFDPYAYSYLFAYPLDLPPDARTLTLPNNERIRILAITVSDESARLQPAQPLYDTLERP